MSPVPGADFISNDGRLRRGVKGEPRDVACRAVPRMIRQSNRPAVRAYTRMSSLASVAEDVPGRQRPDNRPDKRKRVSVLSGRSVLDVRPADSRAAPAVTLPRRDGRPVQSGPVLTTSRYVDAATVERCCGAAPSPRLMFLLTPTRLYGRPRRGTSPAAAIAQLPSPLSSAGARRCY